MGIEFLFIFVNLMSHEQVRTAFYLDRPAAQIQIQQQAYIEQNDANTKKILEAIENVKK